MTSDDGKYKSIVLDVYIGLQLYEVEDVGVLRGQLHSDLRVCDGQEED
jgi:hypothetical protein